MFIAFYISVAFLFVYLFSKQKNATVTVLCTSDHPSHSSYFLFISNACNFDSDLSYFQTSDQCSDIMAFCFDLSCFPCNF